jgi:hypothetical protein
MTPDEAVARCEALNREGAVEQRRFPRQTTPDEWELVSIRAPVAANAVRPSNTSIESQRRAQDPVDPGPLVNPSYAAWWG